MVDHLLDADFSIDVDFLGLVFDFSEDFESNDMTKISSNNDNDDDNDDNNKSFIPSVNISKLAATDVFLLYNIRITYISLERYPLC